MPGLSLPPGARSLLISIEVASFDSWAVAAQVPVTQPLQGIGQRGEEPIIAVDAAHYLEQYRFPAKEPLVTALGGFPMNLEAVITKDVHEIESFGCKLFFFFDGLDYGPDDDPYGTSMEAMATNSRAFDVYEQGDAVGAINDFKQSGFPDVQSLCSFLKTVLHKHGVGFVVAPCRAHAQMIYHLGQGAVDALCGSSELFLYGAHKVITKFSVAHETVEVTGKTGALQKRSELKQDASTFTWIEVDQCLKMLGDISSALFVDALFLAGSSRLETFPPLKDLLQYPRGFTFRNVVDLLLSFSGNVLRLCDHHAHNARLSQVGWADRYMRAVQSVQHMVILISHDMVKPRSHQKTGRLRRPPSDLHELVGLALPEELYYYMYRGMIGPRVMGWLIRGHIKITAPHAGGESKQYRRLVKDQLQPLRRQCLSLLAFSINRYYQQKEIVTSVWFDPDGESRFNLRDFPSPKKQISSWRLRADLLEERAKELQVSRPEHGPGSLYFAFRSLASADFVTKSRGSKPQAYEPLVTSEEIICNVLWRFLYLREYIDRDHGLTPWGEVFLAVFNSLDSTKEQAEAALTAVELLRFGILSADELFPGYGGGPVRGSDEDKRNCLLLSRLACNGKMIHPAKGYSGPLSRHLLAYQCLVSSVRTSLRDLVETVLAVLFLEADAERIREDFLEISEMLPFRDDFSSGLGILTKTYLDELGGAEKPLGAAQQRAVMGRAEDWLIHTDVSGSFKLTCELWDAVLAGVITASSKCMNEEDRKHWQDVDRWFKLCKA